MMITSDNSGQLGNYYFGSNKVEKGCGQFLSIEGKIYNIEKEEHSFILEGLNYEVTRDRVGEVIDVRKSEAALPVHKSKKAPWDAEPVEMVNHPKHYNSHPSGVECIDIVEHMSFNLGQVFKYLWRMEHKGAAIEDLKKAAWYINREIERLGKANDAN